MFECMKSKSLVCLNHHEKFENSFEIHCISFNTIQKRANTFETDFLNISLNFKATKANWIVWLGLFIILATSNIVSLQIGSYDEFRSSKIM